ncbi:MAG: GTP 3',8-cyclase MoaA [Clostridiaceae bacterium]|jgi:cyclic pyranopterin phosphate synthase|nr:GTP 3',8-cyclase MoaA [Bacillota bacterium]NLN51366.1 GTP 3',8-cyclase MoaA [Clostridiaceae bacterium]
MQDQFNRKIEYLRISVTDFCNFRCKYCMPPEGVPPKKREDILTFEELYYVTHLFVENGIKKIRLTGGEPLIRKGVEFFIESLGHLEKVEDLALTTNASLLLGNKAQRLKQAGLKRVNISIDSLNHETFNKLTGGNLDDVLKGFHFALEANLKVKINAVLLKDINDHEIGDFIDLTRKYPIDVRFIEAMPIGPTADFSKKHFMLSDEILDRFELIPFKKQEKSSPARLYRVADGIGRVGLIQPLSHNFCNECNRLRLTADGMIKPCLLSDLLIDVKSPLRKGEDVRPYIEQALNQKPQRHYVSEGKSTTAAMSTIGG